MENLFKERVRFSGLEGETEVDRQNIREGTKPRQKVSLREERKKTQNWFQRQFAGQMSGVEDESDGEFKTAIAAAAYAITLQQEESSLNQQKSVEELGSPLTQTKSINEKSMSKPTDYSKISRWFSGKEAEYRKSSVSGDSSSTKSATLDQRPLEDSAADHKLTGKEMPTTPTIKKTPTFSDKYLNETRSERDEFGQNHAAQQAPSTIKPTDSFSQKGNAKGKAMESTVVETKADAWENAKMDKIKKWYEKMNATALEWENEKKKKAKLWLVRKERELEWRRARAVQEHRNEISRIDTIAGRARALAEERKRNDEFKTIEKARKMRSTGKVPHACPCL